jgi:acylphosphatase
MKHYDIRASGRVQNVGFRWAAKKQAEKRGIAGFVRNEPDGSLYLEAEGEPAALDAFVSWCRKGPWAASVSDVQVREGPARNFSSFFIA